MTTIGQFEEHLVTVPDRGSPDRSIVVARCDCGWTSDALPREWAWKHGQAHLDDVRAADI